MKKKNNTTRFLKSKSNIHHQSFGNEDIGHQTIHINLGLLNTHGHMNVQCSAILHTSQFWRINWENIECVLSRNKPEINPKLIRIIDEERKTVITDTKIKLLNEPGDYFRSLCATWHRCTSDPSSTGMERTMKRDEHYESE